MKETELKMSASLLKLLTFALISNLTFADEYVFSEEQTPAFKDYEQFQDIFPLVESNFTKFVVMRPDPWIVIFHSGMLERAWKTEAVALRGVVWFGMIDVNNNKKLLEQLDYSSKDDTGARLYGYGGEKTKLKSWRRFDDPHTAGIHAVRSLPDETLNMTVGDLEDFLIDSFMSKPTRFPAIFVTDDKEPSPMMKAIALRFKKYYHFGRMVKPSLKDLNKIGLQRFKNDKPSLVVLSASDSANLASPQFSAIPFDTKTMGELTYPNILAFLFSVNREFRHLLPGENMADVQNIVEMADVLEIESLRFDVHGLIQPNQSNKKVVYEEIDESNIERKIVNKISDEL